MKYLPCIIIVILFSCNPKGENAITTNDSTATAATPDLPFDTLVTFCNWSEVGMRDTPSEKGKFLTTIYLGEQVTLAGDSATEESAGKKILFRKVRLSDGKEGWLRDDFLGVRSVPGVITQDVSIYMRPDDAAVSDKKFSFLDVVAVKPSKGNWVEVKGKPQGSTWFQTGFIHLGAGLSLNKFDAELAYRYARAMSAKDEATKQSRIEQIRNDANLQRADVYAMLFPDQDVESDEDPGADGDLNAPQDFVYTFSGTTEELENHDTKFIPDGGGNPNSALFFDGNSFLSKEMDDQENASYCFWLKPEKIVDGEIPFIIGNACSSGYAINLVDDKNGGMMVTVLCGGVNVNITDSDYSIPLNKWVHLCLVKEGSKFTIIVDGKISTSGTSGYNPPAEGLTFGGAWGCNPTDQHGSFYGSMDDLFITPMAIDEERALQIRSSNFN
ncbi:MAG: LamG-like jellyroll fold domain-containing protein [Bacteroidota bacterium]